MDVEPARTVAGRTGITPSNLDWWHAGWLAGLALGAGLLLASSIHATGAALAALAAPAVPAITGLLLARSREPLAEPAILGSWGVAGLAAALLTGGVAGPLGVWLLAPIAAAAAMSRPERLILGVTIAFAALGVTLMSTLALPLPQPPAFALAGVLGAIALITTGLGLGSALIMLQRSIALDRRAAGQTEMRMREALTQQPNLLISVFPTGRLAAAWGQAPPELQGQVLPQRPLALMAAQADRPGIEAAVAQAMETGEAELRFAPAAGGDAWLELTLRRVNATRLMGMIRDARPQIARETALEQARAEAEAQNAGKSRFLANMSHELRTPLNAIMGFADIMKQKLFGPMPDRYADYPELIHESGGHLLELINDVLDMSKIEAERFELHREAFDARDAVNATLRLMRGQADRAGVSLRGLVPREPLDVVADRRALKQIALNLISNALKFTPLGGVVTVTVAADGPMLELIVADTGAGIDATDLQRLGRPFEQAGDGAQRAGGTGLGLSLVRAFAELHGGEMVIESRLGEGTTVIVRMPVMEPTPEPALIVAPEPVA